MSIKELERTAQELQELRRMREELEAEITAAEDAIKEAMGAEEEMHLGAFKVTWKHVTSTRLDSKAIQAAAPDLCREYLKTTTVRRFVIS